jgi:dolichyl-phosphate-mannose-protein mannosyltransferase
MTETRSQDRDLVTAIGFGFLGLFFRLWHLSAPKGLIFDEVYYAKNAHSLLLHGVEIDPKSNAAEFVVHPPVGKWLIALGIKVFGYNEFGWRISLAVVGAISISLIYWVTRKLFDNYFLSCCAAILMTADGLHLVQSRTALLDLFVMFFILLTFMALIYRKHWLAGIALGLACGTKWSGVYYVVAYLAFVLYTDYRTNRAMEKDRALLVTIYGKTILRALQYVIIPIAVYLLSWSGWLLTKTGWDRTWADSPRKSSFSFIPASLRSLWHYHAEILNFHTHLTTKHSYSANPWSWLILGRPTSYFYATPKGCGASTCSQEVIALGTPLLWWSAVFALLITFGYWISRREWQSGLILLSVAAGYLPWFLFQKRTMFSFYAIAFEPFVILTLVFCIAKYLESAHDEKIYKRRRLFVCVWLFLVILNFLYFLPIFTGITIPYHSWMNRMWLPSWI